MVAELEDLAERLPSQVSGVMDLLQRGKLNLRLSHRGLEPSINRLVLGMLTSSLLLGSSVLLAFKVPPLLFTEQAIWGLRDLSVIGLLSFVISLLVSIRLMLAINRSGHLDPSHEEHT